MELVRRDLADTEANIRRDVATKADMELIRRDLADTEANIRRDVATKTDMEAVREDLANFRTEAASKKNHRDPPRRHGLQEGSRARREGGPAWASRNGLPNSAAI